MDEALRCIFEPRSVAVIGASRDPTKRGFQTVQRLVEDRFPGTIYPINPNAAEVFGLPAVPSVADLPEIVDLALIIRPASEVPDILRACGRNGIRGAVIIAGGFGEVGAAGKKLESEIVGVAREEGVRLVGPNTSGIFNLPRQLNPLGVTDVRSGNVALLCQSGNVALSLITEATLRSMLGFSVYIGVGNEADVHFDEYLEYLREDDRTEAIVIYAEGFKDGYSFLQEACHAAHTKPIVIHKSGTSSAGRRSISSHTGALAGEARVAEAAFRQAGVIHIRRSDQLFPAAEALLGQPPMTGRKIAVVTDGGGHGALAADALSEYDISLAELNDGTHRRLRALLPGTSAMGNPIDVAGGADDNPSVFLPVLEAVASDPGVDGVLMVGLFGGYALRFAEEHGATEESTAAAIAELMEAKSKPLVVHSAYAGFWPEAHQVLRGSGIPVTESIDVAARCISVLAERGSYLARVTERSTFVIGSEHVPELKANGTQVLEPQAREILTDWGAPVSPWRLATSAEEARDAAEEFDTRVALKVVSADVLHKSDVGGVLLNRRPDEVASCYRRIVESVHRHQPDATIEGVLISPMAPPGGVEMIVGMTRDPTFGPVVMAGLGGVMVELLRDVAFRVVPLTHLEAEEMLDELLAAPIFAGYRGDPPLDRTAIVDLLLKLSALVQAEPAIEQVDLNPVLLYPDGATIVDARVLLGGGA